MRRSGWLAGVMLLAACAPTIEHPAPAGPAFESDDVRFAAPTGWEWLPSTSISYGPGQILLYVANQPLRADCHNTDTEVVCQSPLADGLHAGGVLVTWVASRCVVRSCELPPGALISIGNRQGVRVPNDYGCEGTDFTERSAYYVTVTPQRVDVLFTCGRDPSDATRSAFLGFLDAIRWRIP
ncbi:MAG: hypothetical protein ABI864_01245 [Chloroflexota bacterium]